MRIIGLTGGIASGKSTATQSCSAAGCTVVDADEEARTVTAAGGEAIAEIRRVFGPGFLAGDGSLDRPKMRSLVFSSAGHRQLLESIIHPLVWERTQRRLEQATGPYAVLAVPLLESILQRRQLLARLLVIDIPPELQLSRLVLRPGITRAQAESIIRSQAGRRRYLEAADDILVNATTREDFRAAVSRLHQRYLELFRGRNV